MTIEHRACGAERQANTIAGVTLMQCLQSAQHQAGSAAPAGTNDPFCPCWQVRLRHPGGQLLSRHAILAHEGSLPVLPFLLDKERAVGVRMRLELRIRGMPRQVLSISDGVLRVQASSGEPVDCRMSVDPVVYLLLIWNRISPWRPVLRGQLAVWGRRPWLVNTFQSLLKM